MKTLRRGEGISGFRSDGGRCLLAVGFWNRLAKKQQRKPFPFIGEVGERCQIEELKLLLQSSRVELAADLDEYSIVLWPVKRCAETRKDDLLRCRGNGIHLDLR